MCAGILNSHVGCINSYSSDDGDMSGVFQVYNPILNGVRATFLLGPISGRPRFSQATPYSPTYRACYLSNPHTGDWTNAFRHLVGVRSFPVLPSTPAGARSPYLCFTDGPSGGGRRATRIPPRSQHSGRSGSSRPSLGGSASPGASCRNMLGFYGRE